MTILFNSPTLQVARTLVTEREGMAFVPLPVGADNLANTFDIPNTIHRCTAFWGTCPCRPVQSLIPTGDLLTIMNMMQQWSPGFVQGQTFILSADIVPENATVNQNSIIWSLHDGMWGNAYTYYLTLDGNTITILHSTGSIFGAALSISLRATIPNGDCDGNDFVQEFHMQTPIV